MKVLVTGGKGFFGSWLVPALEAAGHEVTVYDQVDGNDILDVAALTQALVGVKVIVHLAAYPHFTEKIEAQHFERRNIIGTARVVHAIRAAGVKRLVYTSSGAVYGFGPDRTLDGWVKPPISETKLPAAADWALLDAYSGSKLACEEWLQTVPGLCVTALRINAIEPHHKTVVRTGGHWGWWCSQATAIAAYLAALRRTAPGFVAVNVGEPNPNLDLERLRALLDGTL